MSVWDDTLAAALLGTARRPPPTTPGPGAAGAVLTAVAEQAPEAALLARAATLAVARRAGLRPAAPAAAAAQQDPSVAEPDPRSVVSPASAAHLARMLAGGDARLVLPEWLTRADARGLRPPPELLPALLAVAERAGPGTDERRLALAVAGPRGTWLAAAAGVWPGLSAQRQDVPHSERDLVAAAWDDASPEERVRLLDALAPTLGPDDEPLLERALTDRRKPVRLRAAELLSALPRSAYARRLARLVPPVVELHGGLRGRRLEVTPPDALDPALGLDVKRPKGRGERAHVLVQLASAAPLHAWTDHLALTPDELVRARLPREWANELLTGWAQAAGRQRDVAWARALVDRDPSLAAVLPRDEAERVLAKAVKAGTDLGALPFDGRPWGEELSRALAGKLDRAIDQDVVRPVAAMLHPSVLDEALTALRRVAEKGSWTGRAAVRAMDLITLRQAALAALDEEPRA